MDYYLNIKVLPDSEFEAIVLMNALYAKCHRVLGQVADGEVGVSFPNYGTTLGHTLRLHGSENRLIQLMKDNWLKGMRDYTDISDILLVPDDVQYRIVQHIRTKSPENKRKRSIAKGWLTPEQAKKKIADSNTHLLQLPFAQLTSLSNKSNYRVFVKHGELINTEVKGSFNSYGLSKTATIPWF